MPRLARTIVPPMLTLAALGVIALALPASTYRVAQAGPSSGQANATRVHATGSLSFTFALSQVASGLAAPVHLTHAGDGSGRLFVVEQEGVIRVIKNGAVLVTPFLNITSRVQCCGEEGLLSVAFPPDYETRDEFYVYYTNNSGNQVIARYDVTANPDVGDPNSEQIILTIPHPGQANHNGGQLQFGPNDGYLYIGTGDGGGSGDPNENAQALDRLLGKILRLDVNDVATYTIPASNPFTQTAGARPEIWAYGLRNPWRFSFDRSTYDLYIGDVGQGEWEEVSYQPSASAGGENYGWDILEGRHCFEPSSGCDPTGLISPVVEYGHTVSGEDNCSVTGGYVYRGGDYPWLDGVYFFADYCSGRIWATERVQAADWPFVEKLNVGFSVSSFGEDQNGEVYVVGHGNGRIYKITSTAPADLTASAKSASDAAPQTGDVVTYTIVLRNTGSAFANTVRLTDTIPAGLAYLPGTLSASLGAPDDAAAPTLRWSGVMSNTRDVTVTYAVSVTTTTTQTIVNSVMIDPGFGAPFTRSTSIIAKGLETYLPVILRNN